MAALFHFCWSVTASSGGEKRQLKLDTGQVTAYFGGTGVSVVSLGTKAAEHPATAINAPEIIPLMAMPVPVVQVTLGDLVALGGFAVVVARFVWDIRKDKRSTTNE